VTGSFHYFLRILILLSLPCPALVRFYSTFQLFVRLKVIETDHLITTGSWAFLLRKPIRAQHLSYSRFREGVLTNRPKKKHARLVVRAEKA